MIEPLRGDAINSKTNQSIKFIINKSKKDGTIFRCKSKKIRTT